MDEIAESFSDPRVHLHGSDQRVPGAAIHDGRCCEYRRWRPTDWKRRHPSIVRSASPVLKSITMPVSVLVGLLRKREEAADNDASAEYPLGSLSDDRFGRYRGVIDWSALFLMPDHYVTSNGPLCLPCATLTFIDDLPVVTPQLRGLDNSNP